jgi:acyl carrier protein
MTEDEVYAGLTELLRDIFLRDDLVATPTLTAPDVAGWDSLKQIDVIIAAEQRFGIKFSSREIEELEDVGSLARTVLKRLG